MGSRSTETNLIMKERSKVSFNIEELTNILDGGAKNTSVRRDIEQKIQSDPVLGDLDLTNKEREDLFLSGVRKVLRASEVDLPMGLAEGELAYCVFRALGGDISLKIHRGAFLPTIEKLGTPEQVNKWVPLAQKFNIIGTYAQTELGHGTNLRGLETTAKFDPGTQEFVVNTPKITSMKWWPGDMGKCANHTLVMAQLIVGEKNYGMHPFIVQIRDLDTHMPMRGVKVGDIGEKAGSNANDNGFLILNNVRIPRENMLAGLAEVMPDGSYVKKTDERLMYSSMLLLRVNLVRTSAMLPLQIACTIATRYSVVRRQGAWKQGDPEMPVLDYITQQHKIIPYIATSYAFHFASQSSLDLYGKVAADIKRNDYSNLPELHGLAAGIKAYFTEKCLEGTEVCRRACGGHGYLKSSGFPHILFNQMPSVTYEGENTVMYLQCARYLLKCVGKVMTGQRVEGIPSYLNDSVTGHCPAASQQEMGKLSVLEQCFKHRASCMIRDAALKMQKIVQSGCPHYEAWNRTSVELVNIAKAHLEVFVFSTFATSITSLQMSEKTRQVLTQLCSLYGLHIISTNSGDFLKSGCLTAEQINMAMEEEIAMLSQLRNEAVGLVDAFDLTDKTLRSCLGAYDGNAYERLYENALKSPLNKSEVHKETYDLLRPYLHRGRDILQRRSKL